jgi:hypothetical protein
VGVATSAFGTRRVYQAEALLVGDWMEPERLRPVEVEAGETLEWKALRWSHPRDTNISTSGDLRREVEDQHIQARARRLA